MLSAFIWSEHSYPAMPLAGQPVHQRFVRPGPLVLGSTLLKSPTPTADRDRTVSRRSEPRSRTALMGEQPNPWDLLRPQDATIRHRGAKPPRRCGFCTLVQRRLYLRLFRDGGVLWRSIDLRPKALATPSLARCEKSLQGNLTEHAGRSRCSAQHRCGENPSLGIAPKGFTDMSRCASSDRSDEEPNLTLGGDKPVIPRVAFIR